MDRMSSASRESVRDFLEHLEHPPPLSFMMDTSSVGDTALQQQQREYLQQWHQQESRRQQSGEGGARLQQGNNNNTSSIPAFGGGGGAAQPPHTGPAAHSHRASFANLGAADMEQGQESAGAAQRQSSSQQAGDPQFDLFEWYPKYQSCQRYFTTHAQQSTHVQAVAAFANIALPYQRPPQAPSPHPSSSPSLNPSSPSPSLIPYLRRLVVTGLDYPGILHGFFGDDWATGVGPLHEQERRNYLFAAKSGGWASVKKDYDMLPLETVPFLRPLTDPSQAEIEASERSWSQWLAMEDWMVGPRAPVGMGGGGQGMGQGGGSGMGGQQGRGEAASGSGRGRGAR